MNNDTTIPTSEADTSVTYEVIPLPPEDTSDPSKTGPKPKQLKAVEVFGYEVGRGLKKRIVNPEQIYELAAIGCTDSDIARWFDIDESTLKYNFLDIIAKGREEIKMTLRRAQLQVALGGNPTMLIWLGKQLLGQQETPINSEIQAPLPWIENIDDDEDNA